MYARLYPENIKIFKYEDLVANKEAFMKSVSNFIGVNFEPSMLYPSWNGVEIKDMIAPWGTVLKSTEEYNAQIIEDLNEEEKKHIAYATMALAKHFGYDKVPYLANYYAK
jgi:hypothetical protein